MVEEDKDTPPTNEGANSGSGDETTPKVETPPPTPRPKEEPPKSEETQKAEDLISKANTAAARQEEANKEHAKLLERQEAMNVEKTLGGKTDAGQPPKEETPAEYRDRIMGGDTPPPPAA